MTNYYLGQIGIYGFNFAPRGWAMASGQIISISQNSALFSLLGTTYGGNGQTTFALPDMRSRAAISFGNNVVQGEVSGTETVTVLNNQMPIHTHTFQASDVLADEATVQTNSVFAQGATGPVTAGVAANAYGPSPGNVMLNPASVSFVGGSQPHPNIQPILAVNFCISTTGIYPSRN